MKRLTCLLVLLFSACVLPAQAHGWGYGGGYHGGGYAYYHHDGWGHRWIGPVLGAALVGGAVYAATTPSYAYTVSPPVVVSPPAAPRVAYYCSTSQQYYPQVPTCNVPWQLVGY